MKKIFAYIVGLFILTSATAYAIGAAPLRVEFVAQPGDTVAGEVSIFNDSDTSQTVTISKGDFMVNDNEDLEFYEEIQEENLYSLQDWIYIPNNTIELGPKSQGTIPYEIRIPQDALSQGYYGSLFVESKPKADTREIFGASVNVRIAHLVLLKVEGSLYENVKIEDFSVVQQNQDGNAEFDLVIINEGNVHTSPTGQIEVIDDKGNLVETVDLNKEEYNVLPDSKKTYKQNCGLNELPAGIYYVVLESKTDMDAALSAEMKIEKTIDGEIKILEKNLGEANGKELKEMLIKTLITRNSAIVIIGILLLAVAFAAIAKYCLKCAKLIKDKKKKRKKRVVKRKKK